MSDRTGRKWLIVLGLYLCGAGVWATLWVTGMGPWLLAAALTGAGMALLYPLLLAVVGDVAQPAWRGTSLGVFRMWRDSGYAFGALLIGLVSDTLGFDYGFHLTAATMFISGTLVALVMYETAPARRKGLPAWEDKPGFQPEAPAAEDGNP